MSHDVWRSRNMPASPKRPSAERRLWRPTTSGARGSNTAFITVPILLLLLPVDLGASPPCHRYIDLVLAGLPAMSFDRLSSLEAQPTTLRRGDEYHDDPEFHRLTEQLSNQLFTLTSNISRLSNQIALLGTKRDTERVRERVHDLLEETRAGFKEVGEGIKKVQTWEDVTVRIQSARQDRLRLYSALSTEESASNAFIAGWRK